MKKFKKWRARTTALIMAAALLVTLLPVMSFPASAAGVTKTVYLNGITGDDEKDGTTPEAAVKTFEKAKELLAKDGTIQVTGTIRVTDTQSWSLPEADYGSAKMVFAQTEVIKVDTTTSYSDCIYVEENGTLTLQDIVIDGGHTDDEERTSPGALISVPAGAVTIQEGTILQNNYSRKFGSATYVAGTGTLTIDGGTIRDNESTLGGSHCTRRGNRDLFGQIHRSNQRGNLYGKYVPSRIYDRSL